MAERHAKCFVEGCPNDILYARGICRSCYLYASRLVTFGLTSWRKLEVAGVVRLTMGHKFSPKTEYRSAWFAPATKLTVAKLETIMREKFREVEADKRRRKIEASAKRKAELEKLNNDDGNDAANL